MRVVVAGLLVLMGLSVYTPGAAAAEKAVIIGTAGVTGVYYPTGGAICRLVNRGRKEHNIRCSVESTGGSIYNLEAMREGELNLAIVQSDWQSHAYDGSGNFADAGPDQKLRSVFSLYSEPFTVLVREDSPIKVLDDLKGKRVYMGGPHSGAYATMEELMRVKQWNDAIFSQVTELSVAEQTSALCEGKVDAVVNTAGHPNGLVQEITSRCGTRILDITGSDIDALVKDSPYYASAVVPGGMYKGNPHDVHTFGVKATLVASADLDEDVVYQITKAVFDNLKDFQTLHPVFATLDVKAMVKDGNTAPMHPGALRYFKEVGLYKDDAPMPPTAAAGQPAANAAVKITQ